MIRTPAQPSDINAAIPSSLKLSGRRALEQARLAVTVRMTSATALLMTALFSGLYFTTRTAAYSIDAVRIAADLLRYHHMHVVDDLYQPSHLLFAPFVMVAWAVARNFGYHGGPLEVIEAVNSVCGGIGLGLLYLLLRAILTRSRSLAVLIPIAVGLSFGYWMVATDARAEMPGIAALIGAFLLLVRAMLSPIQRRVALAGVAGAVATLIYLPAILFLPAGLAGIWLAEYTQGTEIEERHARYKNLCLYGANYLLPVILAYGLVGTGIERFSSWDDWTSWITSGMRQEWWVSPHMLSDLRLDAYGLRRALFIEPGAKSGTFHLDEQTGGLGTALYWATLLGWFVAVYALLSATMFLVRTHYRKYLIVALVAASVFGIVFTFVSPGYFVNWIPVTIALAIVLAIGGAYYRGRRYGEMWLTGLALWIAVFGLSNYTLYIHPHISADNNPSFVQAREIEKRTKPGDLIVVSGIGSDDAASVYLPYFAQRTAFSLADSLQSHGDNVMLTSRDLQGAIAKATSTGNRVYAMGDIWDDSTVRARLKDEHGISYPQLLFTGLRRAPAWRDPDDSNSIVWKLVAVVHPTGAL